MKSAVKKTASDDELDSLREQWKTLYASTLPHLARARDPRQKKWPVSLDHCFARIILDNTIGSGTTSGNRIDSENGFGDRNASDESRDAKQEDKSDAPSTKAATSKLRPWDTVIPKPAIRNMTAAQLHAAIRLGEDIASGTVDLVSLDKRSLEGRGKNAGKYGEKKEKTTMKTKTKEEQIEAGEEEGNGRDDGADTGPGDRKANGQGRTVKDIKTGEKRQATLAFAKTSSNSNGNDHGDNPSDSHDNEDSDQNGSRHPRPRKRRPQANLSVSDPQAIKTDMPASLAITTLRRIRDDTSLTPFRRTLYTSLLSVPRGQYTTYAALAEHLGSVARAVGNGMRNNPFAPDVPCHRVLASDGGIGGFGGDWLREGSKGGGKGGGDGGGLNGMPKMGVKQTQKMELLKSEGVRFDARGKVKGAVWKGFWDWRDWEREVGEID